MNHYNHDLTNRMSGNGGAVARPTRLHWSLDVAYGEDQARMREGNSAENFSILRRITLNLIRSDKERKTGVKNCRLKAGWSDAYRQKLLGLQELA